MSRWCVSQLVCLAMSRWRLFLLLPTEFEVTENFGDFWVALLVIRNLLRCLASVFLRDGGSQIYHGYAWFRAVPALARSTFR